MTRITHISKGGSPNGFLNAQMIAFVKLLKCFPANSEGPGFVFFEVFNGIATFHCAHWSSELNIKWQALKRKPVSWSPICMKFIIIFCFSSTVFKCPYKK